LERARGIATTLPECTLRTRIDAKVSRIAPRDAVDDACALFAPLERIATRARAREPPTRRILSRPRVQIHAYACAL